MALKNDLLRRKFKIMGQKEARAIIGRVKEVELRHLDIELRKRADFNALRRMSTTNFSHQPMLKLLQKYVEELVPQ